MFEGHFESLGFNRSEVQVYLALAKGGRGTAQAVGKRASLPRTTVYSVLQNLEAKGLVTQEKKGHTTLFSAVGPGALSRLLDAQQEELTRKKQVAKELAELVQPLFRSTSHNVPKLQFFQGKRAVENMLYEYTDAWRAGIMEADHVWWGYQDHTFVEHYRPWLDYYWKSKSPAEHIQLVSNDVAVEKDLRGKVAGREIRPVSNRLDFSSTIWVCGDYIVLIMTREDPHYAYQLRDSLFASNLRLVFSLLWSKL